MRNRSSLACQDANSSVNHTVNCIFSTYPQGEGLSTELFEQILNQHWGRQEADGKFGWLHLGNVGSGTWQPIGAQQAYDIYVNNGYDITGDAGTVAVSVSSYNPESVPSHIRDYIEGYFLEELGCTDPYAENFSQTANTDDGSCYYIGGAGAEEGCKNQNALNYNPDPSVSACEDCCVMDYVGCTDATALNFDPVATESCVNCCEYSNYSSEDDVVTPPPSQTSDLFTNENIALAAGGVVVLGLVIYALRK